MYTFEGKLVSLSLSLFTAWFVLHLIESHSGGKLPALPVNIRLYGKCLSVVSIKAKKVLLTGA